MTETSLRQLVASLAPAAITVIGDLMVDVFVEGRTDRVSPEAPVPILRRRETRRLPGGAANAAVRCAELDAITELFGRMGRDALGHRAFESLLGSAVFARGVFQHPTVRTTTKTRYLAQGRQILRVDDEECVDAEGEELAFYLEKLAKAPRIVLVSDYGKGVIVPGLMDAVRRHVKEQGGFFLVDPAMGVDPWRYTGAVLLTPNRAECERVWGRTIEDSEDAYSAAESYGVAAGGASVLLTLGEEGGLLVRPGEPPVTLEAHRREVFDVTGAGDAAIAAVARGLAGGLDLVDASRLGMAAGAIAVGRAFTGSVSLADIAALE